MFQKEDWPGYVTIRHDGGRYVGRVWWKETYAECWCKCEFWKVSAPLKRGANPQQKGET